MDAPRFDSWTRALTARGTRRGAATILAGSGLAALLTRLGTRGVTARCVKLGKPCRRGDPCCGGGKCKGGKCKCVGAAAPCDGRCVPGGSCAAPTCSDGVKNGTETGVDCGGSCPKCAIGQGCAGDADCASGRCCAGRCRDCCGDRDCAAPATCGGGGTPNVCGCRPRCAGAVCGDNGWGGACGACNDGEVCDGAACVPDGCGDAEERAFLQTINDFRAAHGRARLRLSSTLTAAAAAHSQDMANRNYPRRGSSDNPHVNPEGQGIQERIWAHGWRPQRSLWAVGENIHVGSATAAGAFAWWADSPPHRANMLDARWEAIGVGRAFHPASDWGWYWTTTFGSELDAGPSCGGAG